MRKLTETEITDLIDYLQGTCMSLHDALNQLFNVDENDLENEVEMCQAIDNAIFNCARCGWWCEAGDWINDEHPNYDPCEETCTQCGDE